VLSEDYPSIISQCACAGEINPIDFKSMHRRIRRESKTVKQMIELYCRKNHSSKRLCSQCSALIEYTQQRLEKCPFQEGKTTCAQCPVHCYNPDMREKIRMVMRYSGPRMIYKHPIAAVWHMIDRRRKEPISQKARTGDKK
jgi:hypothetical protein